MTTRVMWKRINLPEATDADAGRLFAGISW